MRNIYGGIYLYIYLVKINPFFQNFSKILHFLEKIHFFKISQKFYIFSKDPFFSKFLKKFTFLLKIHFLNFSKISQIHFLQKSIFFSKFIKNLHFLKIHFSQCIKKSLFFSKVLRIFHFLHFFKHFQNSKIFSKISMAVYIFHTYQAVMLV